MRLTRIDLHPFHRREINDQAVVARSLVGIAMASAANGDGKVLAASELDGPDYIGNVGAADKQGRVLINHAIPDPASAVVGLVTWNDQVAAQAGFEIVKKE